MVEWYRLGMSFESLMEETLDFIRLFLGELSSSCISYRQALKQYAGIDYLFADSKALLNCARGHELELPKDASSWD